MVTVNPGDQVPLDGCNRIGNFPHGILKNPDALALDIGVKGKTIPLASKKAEYIDDFDSRSLEICEDVEPFAKINAPYVGYLNKKDEEVDPEEANKRWIVDIKISHIVNEESFQASGFCGFCLKSTASILQSGCTQSFNWISDMGSGAWEMTEVNQLIRNRTNIPEPGG